MPTRHGMIPSVQRTLGLLQPFGHEHVACGCGAHKVFEFDELGRMVEICPRCRTRHLYHGRTFRLTEEE